MTLREAHRGFADRLDRMRGVEYVHDERSAERMGHALQQAGRAGFAFVRTEYAKKHSNVTYSGFEVRETKEEGKDLSVLSILSTNGKQFCSWLKFKVSLHALERVQQRRIGVAHKLESFADEFAPALVTCYAEGVARGSKVDFATGETLLATATGALVTSYDQDWLGRVGVTWLAMEQLRPEQLETRLDTRQIAIKWIAMLGTGKKRKSFAGRNDKVELRLRESLQSFVSAKPT